MLSLWKLRVGAEDYYLSQVANGLDDYYSGQGEMPGRWLGNAASGLGLAGGVVAEDLRAVLAGLNPGTGRTPNGEQLRTWKNRVPGFDLTFSVPKSVSVMYALGDPLVRGQIVEAAEVAVDHALGWLEREACFVRRGSNNRAAYRGPSEEFGSRRLRGGGFVASAFRHRTSRAGDPQLHTHVLVANVTRGPDGKWSALDGQALYRSKRAAGVVHDAVLRAELTRRLGVSWGPSVRDAADVAGIPRRVLRLFSKRRAEIEAEMALTGASGPKAAEAATLATRQGKADLDGETLDARWRDEAAAIGYGPADIDELLAAGGGTENPPPWRTAGGPIMMTIADSVSGELVERTVAIDDFGAHVAHALVERDSTFTRHDVASMVASMLRSDTSIATLDRLTDVALSQPHLVPLPRPADAAGGWEQHWTSRHLLDIETDLLTALTPRPGTCGRLNPVAVEQSLRWPTHASLGADQADTVRRVTTQGLPVEVVVGRAGTGKTYAMAAVARLYQTAGYQLVGVAPSGLAARGLTDGAGIDAYTFPRFMMHVADKLTARHVVVVDEAGMAGTVDLHRLITTARHAGAKVILVGDHHQLPEVTAGGAFAAAVQATTGYTAELTINRRQTQAWEIDALAELRHGHVTTAFAAYQAHGRVTLHDHVDDVHTAAVGDWWQSFRSGRHAVLLAGTRGEAKALNRDGRAHAAAGGLLHGPVLELHDLDFQAGDRVLLTRNNGWQYDLDRRRHCRVDNGMMGTIEAIHFDLDAVDLRLLDGRRIRLDSEYLTGGNLDHGYAVTIHKAQGITCDDVFVVGPNGLYRQAGYVAMSRARYAAYIYATSRDASDLTERHHSSGIPLPSEPDDDPEADLLAALETSQAKQLASSVAPHLATIADIANATTLDVLWERQRHVRHITRQLVRDGHRDPTREAERLARARVHRAYMHVGGRVRALDWDNVGTVVAIANQTGTAYVHFVAPDGRQAHRWLDWADAKPIDHPDPADITDSAEDYFTLAEIAVADDLAVWNRLLDDHDIRYDEPVVIPAAVDHRQRQLAHRLAGNPPDWLTWWLGPRPPDPAGAQMWNDEVAALAAWRDARHLPDDIAGYGPAPVPDHVDRWGTHLQRSLQVRDWLQHHTPNLPPEPVTPLEPAQIRARLDDLDAVLADAPPDQTRILHALYEGELAPAGIDSAITDALKTQGARRDWILEHWPHVIEHAELTRLARQHGPLDHWPVPLDAIAQHLLDQVRAISSATPEPRALTELDAEVAATDPRARFREIDTHLNALDATIRHLADERSALVDRFPDRVAQLDTHLDELHKQHNHLSDQHRRQRGLATLWGTGHRPHELVTAINRRSNHLAHTAITDDETWVIEAVRAYHDTHPRHRDPAPLQRLITEIAAHRERTGHTGNDPLGPELAPDHPHHQQGQRLDQQLHQPAPPRITDTLGLT